MAGIGARPLALLCRRLATSLDAGVDVRRALDTEASRGPFAQRDVMRRIADSVGRGESLAAAIDQSDGYFPPLVREMVDVGERTGRLEQVLYKLADHYDHLIRLRRVFLAGIAMPAIQLTVAILVIGLFIYIIGMFADENSPAANVVGPGMSGTRGLIKYMFAVTILLGTPALAIVAMIKGWLPAAPIMALLIRVPVLGNCIEAMALSRFTWSLAMAHDAGMDPQRTLRLAQRSTHNPYYTSRIARVDETLARGLEMNEALRSGGGYPDELLDSLENAERAGKVSEAMVTLSSDYQSRAETLAATLTTIAAFAVWAMVAAVIIYFIFRMAMVLYIGPIYDAIEMTK